MPEPQAVLWPSREHYPRFREICGKGVHDTYEGFVAAAQPMVDEMLAAGMQVRKVDFDPDDMARWCAEHFGAITPTSRAAYIAALVLSDDTDGSA